jgi:CheY-like chemotaxis protein
MARILIVDDDEDTCDLFATILQDAGHTVQVAMDGEQGLRVFHVWKPEVVLLDMFMPEMDGLETVSALLQSGASVKIIAVSGGYRFHRSGASGDIVDQALAMGAHLALQKPVDPERLQQAIDTVTGGESRK